jgi:hypothetical protein
LVGVLLVFAASQTLAQQHFHSADDLTTCVICAHGDHSPVAHTAAGKTPTAKHQTFWRIGFSEHAQTSTQWPAFQSRAPPLN